MNKKDITEMKFKLKSGNDSGFTLVETMVAISLLLLILIAAFSVSQSSIQSSIHARDQVVASFLLQEQIEYIKNVKDSNTLGGGEVFWLSGLEICFSDQGAGCAIDVVDATVVDCNASVCRLYKNNSTDDLGIYSPTEHTGWSESIYSLLVSINVSDDIATIVTTISWEDPRAQDREISFTQRMYNWHKFFSE